MIPAEAVEAAAEVMASQTDEPPYGESSELDAEYRRDAREILEAAAPHMLAALKVTAVDELEALPNDSLVRTDRGFVFEKEGHWWAEPGTRDKSTVTDIDLPATVLYVGGSL